MRRRRLLPLYCLAVLACPHAFGQRFSEKKWATLRTKIAQGQDPSILLGTQFHSLSRSISYHLPLTARQQIVVSVACRDNVPPALALGIVSEESGFQQIVVGPFNEVGAGQILPATALAYGFDLDRLAIEYRYNIQASLGILRTLLDEFPMDGAIAAYNGGVHYRARPPSVQEKVRRYVWNVHRRMKGYSHVRCE